MMTMPKGTFSFDKESMINLESVRFNETLPVPTDGPQLMFAPTPRKKNLKQASIAFSYENGPSKNEMEKMEKVQSAEFGSPENTPSPIKDHSYDY